MPPQKSRKKDWIFVPSGLKVGEVRKKGLLWKNRIGKKLFSSFDEAERYRKKNKLKKTKSVPISSKDIPKLSYMKKETLWETRVATLDPKIALSTQRKEKVRIISEAERKASIESFGSFMKIVEKPKASLKPKVIPPKSDFYIKPKPEKKKKEVIESIKRSIKYNKKRVQEKRDKYSEASEKKKEYMEKYYKTSDKYESKYLKDMAKKVISDHNKAVMKLEKEVEKDQNKLIRTNLNTNRVRRIVEKVFPGKKSKYHKSGRVRGFGTTTTGYEITTPNVYEKEISIHWHTGGFTTSIETDKKNTKKFKEKLKPVLDLNGIKYEDEGSYIIIKQN